MTSRVYYKGEFYPVCRGIRGGLFIVLENGTTQDLVGFPVKDKLLVQNAGVFHTTPPYGVQTSFRETVESTAPPCGRTGVPSVRIGARERKAAEATAATLSREIVSGEGRRPGSRVSTARRTATTVTRPAGEETATRTVSRAGGCAEEVKRCVNESKESLDTCQRQIDIGVEALTQGAIELGRVSSQLREAKLQNAQLLEELEILRARIQQLEEQPGMLAPAGPVETSGTRAAYNYRHRYSYSPTSSSSSSFTKRRGKTSKR